MTICPICLITEDESENNLCITNCDHSFCRTCLHKWLELNHRDNRPLCPICRQRIDSYIYGDENIRLIYINNERNRADDSIDINELSVLLGQNYNNTRLNRKLKISINIITTISVFFMGFTIYLSIGCND